MVSAFARRRCAASGKAATKLTGRSPSDGCATAVKSSGAKRKTVPGEWPARHNEDVSQQTDGDRGRRRLDRAPGERYAGPARQPAAPESPAPHPSGSIGRSVAFAIGAAVIALFAYVGLAGPLAFSSGLVIAAIFAGRIIGLSARAGAGRAISYDRKVLVALIATLVWFVAAQVATWLYARGEGGVLPIVDYLLQTFGPIVPLVAIASILAAWWSAR
jgi:hypothetical protein